MSFVAELHLVLMDSLQYSPRPFSLINGEEQEMKAAKGKRTDEGEGRWKDKLLLPIL